MPARLPAACSSSAFLPIACRATSSPAKRAASRRWACGSCSTTRSRTCWPNSSAGAFDAVYVAVGAQANRARGHTRRGTPRGCWRPCRSCGTSAAGERPRLGRRVVIYGGGNTAMDAARTARRLGAEEAVIVYRRDRAHMPAHPFEADEAAAEGVKIKWLSGIKDISGSDITVERMELDADGRPQPTGEFETLKADTVILALGQTTDIAFLRRIPGIEFAADGTIIVGDDMQTGHPGIFAGGDVTPATRTVTNATGQGKRAARHIDAWLRGEALPRSDRHRVIPFEELHLPMYNDTLAPRETEVPPDERKGFAEVVMGLDAGQAQHEAGRCLSCGNCYECDNCYAACPEDAIVKLGSGPRLRDRHDALHRLRDLLRPLSLPCH